MACKAYGAGLSDQARDIALRVAQPARLFTAILAEFFQLPMRQVPPRGVRGDLVGCFFVRHGPSLQEYRTAGRVGPPYRFTIVRVTCEAYCLE
jgi:hypothetical protein